MSKAIHLLGEKWSESSFGEMAEEPEKVSSSSSGALQKPPPSSSGEVAVFKPQVGLFDLESYSLVSHKN